MGHRIIPYITKERLEVRIAQLGQQISADYKGKDLLLLSILKGSVVFLSDLMRALTLIEEVTIDFMVVSSYGQGQNSSGNVQITKDLATDVRDKDILIVEDILDSGNTLSKISQVLCSRSPRSLRICALLDKPSRRTTPVPLEYSGFVIPDEFVVGYGLDYQEHYRNLPYIGRLQFINDQQEDTP